MVTLIAFLLMLGLLVLVHELGHFLTAVWLGIKVEEFGFGFPPRALVLFERKGVKYTLNWLPIGGFVRFGGEGETVYGVGSLSSASPWKKIAVLIAGPLMNLVLAIVIFSALFGTQGIPADGAHIGTVYPNTPAATAGFQQNDLILELNGQPLGRRLEVIRQAAERSGGAPITAVVQRGDQTHEYAGDPRPLDWPDKANNMRLALGLAMDPDPQIVSASLPVAVTIGVETTFNILGSFVNGLSQALGGLFGLNEPPPGGVTGIVGIARGTGEVIEQRWHACLLAMDRLYQPEPVPGEPAAHPGARWQPYHVLADRGSAARQEDPARARGAGPCDRVYGADGPDADYYGLGCRQLDRRRACAGPLISRTKNKDKDITITKL